MRIQIRWNQVSFLFKVTLRVPIRSVWSVCIFPLRIQAPSGIVPCLQHNLLYPQPAANTDTSTKPTTNTSRSQDDNMFHIHHAAQRALLIINTPEMHSCKILTCLLSQSIFPGFRIIYYIVILTTLAVHVQDSISFSLIYSVNQGWKKTLSPNSSVLKTYPPFVTSSYSKVRSLDVALWITEKWITYQLNG